MGRYMSKTEKAAMKADLEKRQAASRTRAGKAAAMGKGNEPKYERTPKKRPSEPLEKFKPGWALPKAKPAKTEETGNAKTPSGRVLTDKEQKALDAANARKEKTQRGNARREEFSARLAEQRAPGSAKARREELSGKLAEQRAARAAGRAAAIAGGK